MLFKRILLISVLLLTAKAFSQSAPEALKSGQDINVLFRHEATFKILMASLTYFESDLLDSLVASDRKYTFG